MPTYLNPGQAERANFGISAGAVAGDYVFATGMALDWRTVRRQEEAETIADETHICFQKLSGTLAEAGCSLTDVVKVTCYLTDESYYDEFKGIYDNYFKDGHSPVAVNLIVGIAGGCRVELDAIAKRPEA